MLLLHGDGKKAVCPPGEVLQEKNVSWGKKLRGGSETTAQYLQMMDTNFARLNDMDIHKIMPLMEAPASHSAIPAAADSTLVSAPTTL